MIYHIQLDSALGPEMPFMGTVLNVDQAATWVGSVLIFLIGIALLALGKRFFVKRWNLIQEQIQADGGMAA
jgi:branched-chain amino acid transport system permease protein